MLSHPTSHYKNISLCINILLNNGYPLDLIFKFINKRISYLSTNNINIHKNSNSEDNNVAKNQFMILPYADSFTKAAEISLKNSDIKLGLKNLLIALTVS